ncbi:MAG: TetR/AcrR family transcriptional regulator [Proteobacteria bacterium]|nr:TetR/AcrR family transcriptional regulator [Pseudomonadota bacterium]
MLERGLSNTSLRGFASAAGTSDRMLLYYFSDKNDLMISAFECFVQRLSVRQNDMLPAGRQPFDVLLTQMWIMLKAPEYEPYLRIWYDALGHAAHGEELYRSMTSCVLDVWLKFFEPRLDAPPRQRRFTGVNIGNQFSDIRRFAHARFHRDHNVVAPLHCNQVIKHRDLGTSGDEFLDLVVYQRIGALADDQTFYFAHEQHCNYDQQ